MLEEAEKRDHRRLGKQLDLFHLHDEAPGMVFWHPQGLDRLAADRAVHAPGAQREHGYQEVKTPQVIDRSLWEKSGHWDNYRDNMFTTESEKRDYAIKPMNCPGHVQIYNQRPEAATAICRCAMAEFGSCHRNEPSGALHGLMRVRGFMQDDAHIFCTEDQIVGRGRPPSTSCCPASIATSASPTWRSSCRLRPEKRVGSDEVWDKAEAGLREALTASGLPVGRAARRGRLLRPEDRIPRQGRLGSLLAVRHHAARLQAAGASRRRRTWPKTIRRRAR